MTGLIRRSAVDDNDHSAAWVMDITKYDATNRPLLRFVRIDIDKSRIQHKRPIFAKTSPGKLVGIIHLDGVDHLNKWLSNNVGWFHKYKHINQKSLFG